MDYDANMRYKFIPMLISGVFLLSACGQKNPAPSVETAQPQIRMTVVQEEIPRVTSPTGRSFPADAEHINLPGVQHADFDALVSMLQEMEHLNYVNLGKEKGTGALTFEDLFLLISDFPEIKFDYTYDVFGKPVSLDDDCLDFNHIQMDDNGEKLCGVIRTLRSFTYLDADFTGIDNAVMEQLREDYPDADINWRVWFGTNYSVRTDVERIIASNPDTDCLTGLDTQVLKYCTKVRFIDIGHNKVDDISFIANMPELESAVICLNEWSDLSPIVNCKKLNYLEINDTACTDLSPLSALTSLEHLNIGNLKIEKGWEALENLTNLKRLWITSQTYVPPDVLQSLKASLPHTVINTDQASTDLGEWRWLPGGERNERYEQLFMEMGYYKYGSALSYYYNDEKYYPEGYTGSKCMWPKW